MLKPFVTTIFNQDTLYGVLLFAGGIVFEHPNQAHGIYFSFQKALLYTVEEVAGG
jgi:hypothetical protein